MQYVVTATITLRETHLDRTWTSVRQVPAFLVDARIHGFTDAEGAARVAMSVLTAMVPAIQNKVEQISLAVFNGNTSVPSDAYASLTKNLLTEA